MNKEFKISSPEEIAKIQEEREKSGEELLQGKADGQSNEKEGYMEDLTVRGGLKVLKHQEQFLKNKLKRDLEEIKEKEKKI